MKSVLPPLNEYGFLPVPPPVYTVRLEDMPGCFGAKPKRMDLWKDCLQYIGWLQENTPVPHVYVDGRFLSASDEIEEIEVGIELSKEVVRGAGGLHVFNIPARDEFGVRVRFFAPHRPDRYNFHEEFNTPDPEVRLRGAPSNLRKGYVRIEL